MYIEEALKRYSFTSNDTQQYRYWSPTAQKFASGDQLARKLHEGWRLGNVVAVQNFWVGEARQITVFHVTLKRNNEEVTMGVLANPFARELLTDERLGLKLVVYKPQVTATMAVSAK